MNPQDFISTVAPIATELYREGSPIFPSVRIAQAKLETGCKLHSWNNLVGFKVGRGQHNAFWKGQSVSASTWEVYNGIRYDGVQANWRVYATVSDCFCDQDLLFQYQRYERVSQSHSPQEQTKALYLCGYATDPAYADKLNNIINQHNLEQYDEKAHEPMLNPDIANTIIQTWMKKDWQKASQMQADAQATGYEDAAKAHKDQADYIHWLANELGKASGQPHE